MGDRNSTAAADQLGKPRRFSITVDGAREAFESGEHTLELMTFQCTQGLATDSIYAVDTSPPVD